MPKEEPPADMERDEFDGASLEQMIKFPTWKEMLLDLISAEKVDPWNIDIAVIAGHYLERLKRLELTDLHVPANLVLAASILLRFKSKTLQFQEPQPEEAQGIVIDEGATPIDIPVLELKGRIPPKRRVTLDELLVAMEQVFDEQKKRQERIPSIEIPPALNIFLPEMDMDTRMGEVEGKIHSMADSEGLVLFSTLLNGSSPDDKIFTLLPVLHLAQNRRLGLFQEQFFGEIFIQVLAAEAKDKKSKSNKE
jgi:segregation and condensation protein A